MKKTYINSVCSISIQKTFDNETFLDEVVDYNDNVAHVVNPNYKDYIPPASARRMAKGIKMGIVASKIALQEAELENVDAIITGTGMGCLRDSEKFLSAIIDNDEQYLTPTSFIQSTHNTVGGQIALELNCKGYNFTYVHGSISLESAILDAKSQLENNEAENILIGSVDELGDHTTELNRVVNHIKKEKIPFSTLLQSKSKGSVYGEGAHFFTLSNKLQESTYAEFVSVELLNTIPKENLTKAILKFLESNQLDISNIDAIVLGNNGDIEFDDYYDELTENSFKNTQQVWYKHLSGEYHTASGFGLWLASIILKTQVIPEVVKLNKTDTTSFKHILLYNQYRGENHSFTLLKKC